MDFENIGLTKNESKAYDALLHLGKSAAAQISKESEVPYGRIYDVLSSLEAKGLVKVVPEKTKKFIPADPASLHDYILSKKKALDDMEEKVKHMKAVYEQHEKEPVQIIKGKNNFYKVLRQIHGAKKYEYDIKYNFDTHPESIREGKRMVKSKVDYKLLGRIDQETKKNVDVWKKLTSNIKSIDNEGVALALIDGEELMITLIKANTIMLIKDKPFIKLMQTLFENYYER